MSLVSGAEWCSRFPTSTRIEDLDGAFRGCVARFVDALREAGASVVIADTYRPPERCYLMHYAWMIANAGQDPELIPPMQGVDIDWAHGGDVVAARYAADAMVSVYGIRYPPA